MTDLVKACTCFDLIDPDNMPEQVEADNGCPVHGTWVAEDEPEIQR